MVERTGLSGEQARAESIFLGLRLMRGFNLQNYLRRFGNDLRDEYEVELVRLRDAGLIEVDENLIRLTTRGALLSNEVMTTFL